MAAPKKHVFVINQMGQSAHRHGAFKDREAAIAWADKHYHYPCWIIPAEFVGKGPAVVLDADGNKVSEGS